MNKLRNGKYREHETLKWYQNGVLHREDEPAFEGKNGSQSWYLNGVQYTEEEFKNWESKKFLNEKLQNNLSEKEPIKK